MFESRTPSNLPPIGNLLRDPTELRRRIVLNGDLGALATHVSYPARRGRTAVIRGAALTDIVALGRFAARRVCSGPEFTRQDRRERRDAILEATFALHRRGTIHHLVEIDGAIGALRRCHVAAGRIVADATVLTANALAFDPEIALRIAEHVVQCCRLSAWPTLTYCADFASDAEAEAFAARLVRQGFAAEARMARLKPLERLRFGRRRHEIRVVFPKSG